MEAASIERAAAVARGSVALLRNTAFNVERLVRELVVDSAFLGRELAALGVAMRDGASSAQRFMVATPRLARILKEVGIVAASYRLHKARWEVMGVEPPSETREALHRENAERLYRLCTDLRGALIKVGQLASARADILPPPYVEVLSRLQDRVPPVDAESILERIEEELEAPLSELFSSVELEPIAPASLAQVHRARLEDGRDVAVKVQLPGVSSLVITDLLAMRVICRQIGDLLPTIDLDTIVDEIAHSVLAELDYEAEASHATGFLERYAGCDTIAVPAVVPGHSSARVLTMHFLEGQRSTHYLDDREAEGDAGAGQSAALFTALIDFYCDQILVQGIFHADPHPGNFLVLPGPTLGVLDFGAVAEQPDVIRHSWGRIVEGMMRRDAEAVAAQLLAMGFGCADGDEDAAVRYVELMFETLADDIMGSLADVDPVEQLENGIALFEANPFIRIPPEMVALGRVFATLSGLVMRYKPAISLPAILLPRLTAAVAEANAA